MHQERLFRLAVEAGGVSFAHEAGRGWRLTITVRRGRGAHDEVERSDYSALTTVELLDTISAHLDSVL